MLNVSDVFSHPDVDFSSSIQQYIDGGSLASLMVSEGDGESDGVRGNGEQ